MSEFWTWVYGNVGVIKFGICFLLLIIAAIFILRLFNIKSLRSRKGVRTNIESIKTMYQRDRNIIAVNRLLKILSAVGKIKLISYDEITRDYMNYNLRRAGVRAPGGLKTITADEFRGAVVTSIMLLDILSIVLIPIIGISIAFIVIVGVTMLGSILPQTVVRSMVYQKDAELKEGFPDFYLMLHYVLLTGAQTPISRIMQSYARTTDNVEVLRLIDVCVDNIETYGEYSAMSHIARSYREVPEVGKLCRLIKQLNEGADIKNELLGFRSELIQQKKWAIEARGDKIIKKAKMSFNILMLVLIQAVISAMLIYLPDISSAGGLFGL